MFFVPPPTLNASVGSRPVAHAGFGSSRHFSLPGEPLLRIRLPKGNATTRLAFGGAKNRTINLTESQTDPVLREDVGAAGAPMYSPQS